MVKIPPNETEWAPNAPDSSGSGETEEMVKIPPNETEWAPNAPDSSRPIRDKFVDLGEYGANYAVMNVFDDTTYLYVYYDGGILEGVYQLDRGPIPEKY